MDTIILKKPTSVIPSNVNTKHWAQLDENNIVINIIISDEDFVKTLPNSSTYVETVTKGNSLRNRPAVIGGSYDSTHDTFIDIKPYDSWVLDQTYNWVSPVPKPTQQPDKALMWSEDNKNWVYITQPKKSDFMVIAKGYARANSSVPVQTTQTVTPPTG